MEADNLKRRSVTKGLPVLLLGIIAILAVIIYVALNPSILEDILVLVIVIIIVIAVLVVIAFAVMMILAIPFYFLKGEKYQEGGSYDLDDVKSVKESSSKDKKE